uniref:Uncharacterized protein n=1 Tax=Timema poppense TaxID=170557 RepID=A0A7R9CXM8_TIMPO|nr:unnamed protein product [Timema poppensis]
MTVDRVDWIEDALQDIRDTGIDVKLDEASNICATTSFEIDCFFEEKRAKKSKRLTLEESEDTIMYYICNRYTMQSDTIICSGMTGPKRGGWRMEGGTGTNGGEIDCWPMECPPFMCSEPILTPGDCCPRCDDDPCALDSTGNTSTGGLPCTYAGRLYDSGTQWRDPNDKCTACNCKDGRLCCSYDFRCDTASVQPYVDAGSRHIGRLVANPSGDMLNKTPESGLAGLLAPQAQVRETNVGGMSPTIVVSDDMSENKDKDHFVGSEGSSPQSQTLYSSDDDSLLFSSEMPKTIVTDNDTSENFTSRIVVVNSKHSDEAVNETEEAHMQKNDQTDIEINEHVSAVYDGLRKREAIDRKTAAVNKETNRGNKKSLTPMGKNAAKSKALWIKTLWPEQSDIVASISYGPQTHRYGVCVDASNHVAGVQKPPEAVGKEAPRLFALLVDRNTDHLFLQDLWVRFERLAGCTQPETTSTSYHVAETSIYSFKWARKQMGLKCSGCSRLVPLSAPPPNK